MSFSIMDREIDAKSKLRYYYGETDIHPHGESGKKWVIPYDFSKRISDCGCGLYGYPEFKVNKNED